MEFNKLVKIRLLPIFQEQGFEIVEEFKNIIRFESAIMKVNVVYNDYDKSHFIEIGKRDSVLYPLSDNVVKNIFDFELPIEEVTSEVFVKNLALIFTQKEGVEILKGNIEIFIKLSLKEIHDYNAKLLKNQMLDAATKAWEKKEYRTFVEIVDNISINEVPKTYLLKYKIAKQNL